MTIDNSDDEVEISSTPGRSSKHKKDKRMDLSKLAYKFSFAIGEQCMMVHSLGDSEHARTAPKSSKECSRNRRFSEETEEDWITPKSAKGSSRERNYSEEGAVNTRPTEAISHKLFIPEDDYYTPSHSSRSKPVSY